MWPCFVYICTHTHTHTHIYVCMYVYIYIIVFTLGYRQAKFFVKKFVLFLEIFKYSSSKIRYAV